jgi:hypothetical protein
MTKLHGTRYSRIVAQEILMFKSILDKRIQECFRVITKERKGSSDEDDTNTTRPPSRSPQDLLKSDLLSPSSSPVTAKRKQYPNSSLPVKEPRSPPPKKSRPAVVKREAYNSDDDAKLAAELDQLLNSSPRRKTRGATSGAKAKPRSKKIKVKNGAGDDGELPPKKKRTPNPNSAFNAPMLLSPQLAEIVFETELPRPVTLIRSCDSL